MGLFVRGHFREFDEMGKIDGKWKQSIGGVVCFTILVNVILAADYVPADNILLNCGSSAPQTTDTDGRKWTTDIDSKFVLSTSGSSTSDAATQAPDVDEVPFMSARIFNSHFTYSLPVAPGRKFLRLYFYPNTYQHLNATNAIFSVNVGPYTLLSNFSAAQTTQALNYNYLIKEYAINVDEDRLHITFKPSTNYSNSYAFVNGIEVVSMPYIYDTRPFIVGPYLVGGSTSFAIDKSGALEGLYRLNVGGNYISPTKDTGLFRAWYDDTPYVYGAATGVTNVADPNVTIEYPRMMPSYTAPVVYSTARLMTPNNQVNLNFNLTWLFTIDTGFAYLIRLHFCQILFNIYKINQVEFNIYINNQTAYNGFDVVGWVGGNGIPCIQDYVIIAPAGNEPQQNLWLALSPDTSDKPQYYNAFLNGVEIFKINNTDGNLAGPNPIPSPKKAIVLPPAGTSSRSSKKTAVIGGGVCLVGFIVCFVSRRRMYGKVCNPSDGPSGWIPLSLYGNSHTYISAKTTTT